MKKFFILILVAVSIVGLLGCKDQETKQGMPINQNIKHVDIANSSGLGGLNENFWLSTDKPGVLEALQELMKSAKRENIDIDEPTYDMEIIYEDGTSRGLHL
ncbi:hypothetical protein [Lentibacillus salinarum]|uniref:Uncharacterized protein n=1 Tax=Lentibacillus salinarum TaxID=446820 RepID=A0ABW3ZRZ2_9BACI